VSRIPAAIWPAMTAPLSTPDAISPPEACRRSDRLSIALCTSPRSRPNGPEAISRPSSCAPPVIVSLSVPTSEANGGTMRLSTPMATSSAPTNTIAVAAPGRSPRRRSACMGGTSTVASKSATNAGNATSRTYHRP
jgi:hypothetical protein